MKKKKDNLAKKKKKFGFFYGSSISLLLIAFMALFYFLVLVSSKPKSIPYVTHKIEDSLKNNFGSDSSLEESYVSFTRYGTIKIAITNLRIFYVADLGNDKKTFLLPSLELEFCLLDMLLMNFEPNKIRLINPDIVIADLAKFKSSKVDAPKESQIAILLNFFSSIHNSSVEFLEIENASLIMRSNNSQQKILLKKSRIHLTKKKEILNITGENQLSFDSTKSDVNFGFDCHLSEKSDPRCDAFLTNFSPDSISNLSLSLKDLGKISAIFDVSASATLKEGGLENISFKLKSEKGNFEFLDFFSTKIDFRNFTLSGIYDYKLKLLNLDNLEADLSRESNVINPHISLSANFSNLGEENQKTELSIKINDVLGDDLAKFWPVNLNQVGVRDWVTQHINKGLIKNASTKFSLHKVGQEVALDDINAEVNFSGMSLSYHKNFPEISNIAGTAKFTKKDMKIALSAGDVLQSKVSDALVAIDDFNAANVLLKITGNAAGHASDGVKHSSDDKGFRSVIEKYLNGASQTSFNIQLSLSKEITLKNSYIAANSSIADLNNEYLHGSAIIKTKKDINSSAFVTNVDLTKTEISAKALDIIKKPLVESSLDFALVVDDKYNILVKNLLLISKEQFDGKKSATLSKISGNAYIETSPFLLSSLNFKNENFGKNNYSFSYRQENKTSPKIISLNGAQLNFGALIQNKFFKNFESADAVRLNIQASVRRLDLLQNKFFRNYSLSLNCDKICLSGFAKATYGNKQMMNFIIAKNPKNDFSTIEGRISDVGYLAEGLGISNVVSGGDVKVKMQHKILKDKAILEGEVDLKEKITIFETPTVKRLSKDTLFSSVKDKIFSSEKTIFDTVKLEFDFNGEILNINKLIANNYKIGITSKGAIDLKNNSYNLKGMIVPGFIINNLFGIGNLPILGSLLTGGEGGGVFGIRYEYVKNKNDKEAKFSTNKVTSFVPSTIQNLFDF